MRKDIRYAYIYMGRTSALLLLIGTARTTTGCQSQSLPAVRAPVAPVFVRPQACPRPSSFVSPQ